MNYLAHLLLSGENKGLVVGNFMGDFVKGSQLQNFPLEIQKGILLHREIDDFTDNHPKVKEDINRIKPQLGRYSPIAIDIFYDYLLTQNWEKFNDQSLVEFTKKAYSTIQEHKDYLPEKCQHLFFYMKRDNWLYNYQFKEGINRALQGLSRRTKYESFLQNAMPILNEHQDLIEKDFISFFEQLSNHISTKITIDN